MATKKTLTKTVSRNKGALAPSVTKVALLGFGTVGSSVARVLAAQKFPGIELTHIFNRNVERKRSSAAAKFVPKSVIWTAVAAVLSVDLVDMVSNIKVSEAMRLKRASFWSSVSL